MIFPLIVIVKLPNRSDYVYTDIIPCSILTLVLLSPILAHSQ